MVARESPKGRNHKIFWREKHTFPNFPVFCFDLVTIQPTDSFYTILRILINRFFDYLLGLEASPWLGSIGSTIPKSIIAHSRYIGSYPATRRSDTYLAVGISKIAKFTKTFENHKNKNAKTTASSIPAWSPTAVLTGPFHA